MRRRCRSRGRRRRRPLSAPSLGFLYPLPPRSPLRLSGGLLHQLASPHCDESNRESDHGDHHHDHERHEPHDLWGTLLRPTACHVQRLRQGPLRQGMTAHATRRICRVYDLRPTSRTCRYHAAFPILSRSDAPSITGFFPLWLILKRSASPPTLHERKKFKLALADACVSQFTRSKVFSTRRRQFSRYSY